MPGEQSQGRVRPHDPAETAPQHPQKTVGGQTLVAVLLRRKLRRSAYRRNTPVHRTAANAALTAAKDAYGVRAILPRPEGRGLTRNLIKQLRRHAAALFENAARQDVPDGAGDLQRDQDTPCTQMRRCGIAAALDRPA